MALRFSSSLFFSCTCYTKVSFSSFSSGLVLLQYLFSLSFRLGPSFTLAPVPEDRWTFFRPRCCPIDSQRLLDVAEEALRRLSEEFKLPACILRKERAVGLIRRPPELKKEDQANGAYGEDGMKERKGEIEKGKAGRKKRKDERKKKGKAG